MLCVQICCTGHYSTVCIFRLQVLVLRSALRGNVLCFLSESLMKTGARVMYSGYEESTASQEAETSS